MMIAAIAALAVLALAYGLFRRRSAKLEQQKQVLRHERRRKQDETWEKVLADQDGGTQAGDG